MKRECVCEHDYKRTHIAGRCYIEDCSCDRGWTKIKTSPTIIIMLIFISSYLASHFVVSWIRS